MRLINAGLAIALLIIYPPLFVVAVAVDLFVSLLQTAWRVLQYALYSRPMPTSFWSRSFCTQPLQRSWYDCWQANNQANYRVMIGLHNWGSRIGRGSHMTRSRSRPAIFSHGKGGGDAAARPSSGSVFYTHSKIGGDAAARPSSGSVSYTHSKAGGDTAARPGTGSLPNNHRSSIAERPGNIPGVVPGEHREDTKPACTSTQNWSLQGVAARPEQHGANHPDISFDISEQFKNSRVGLHKLDTAITATPAFASTQNVSLPGVGQRGVNHPDISFDINKQFNNTSHDSYQIPVTPTLETWNNMPKDHSPFSGMGPGFDMPHRHW